MKRKRGHRNEKKQVKSKLNLVKVAMAKNFKLPQLNLQNHLLQLEIKRRILEIREAIIAVGLRREEEVHKDQIQPFNNSHKYNQLNRLQGPKELLQQVITSD